MRNKAKTTLSADDAIRLAHEVCLTLKTDVPPDEPSTVEERRSSFYVRFNALARPGGPNVRVAKADGRVTAVWECIGLFRKRRYDVRGLDVLSASSREPRHWTASDKRLCAYMAILLAIVVWDYLRRCWVPDFMFETEHYAIESTATRPQTEEIGRVVEALYSVYVEFFQIDASQALSGKLKLKLFKNRKEFRFCNRMRGWAEAFYRKPYCYQYYPADATNPYHWMVHEATHQLNSEVAGFTLAKWLDEGIACYFSTSQFKGGRFQVGMIDSNTYPVWWLTDMNLIGNLHGDIEAGRIIPLRAIITGRDGPDIDEVFNLYYLHWWLLVRFLFEYDDGRYQDGVLKLTEEGGRLPAFEEYIGPVDQIQAEWYEYVSVLQKPDGVLRRNRARADKKDIARPLPQLKRRNDHPLH